MKTSIVIINGIKRDKRAKGVFYHKSKGFHCMKAKDVAMKDITKYCERNYVYVEFKIINYV